MKTFDELINDTLKHKEEPKSSIQDELGCIMCQLLEALNLSPDFFDNPTEETVKKMGGNMDVIIEIGGPSKAYSKDKIESVIKNAIPHVKGKKDIKSLRNSESAKNIKELLDFFDDDNLSKIVTMKAFRNGGEIEIAKEGTKVREYISGDLVPLPENLTKEQSEGKAIIKTIKGDVVMQKNGTCVYVHRLRKHAEGGQLSELDTIKVTLGNKDYTLYEAYSNEEKSKGLQKVKGLKDNEGMIFYYEKPENVSFWMKDCDEYLDIIFINEQQEVISVKQGIPNDESPITCDNVSYVVELKSDQGIQVGDDLEFEEEPEFVMKVIGSDGETQMGLYGGERIISRKETVVLIRKVKKAYNAPNDKKRNQLYKSVGKYIFKVLNGQDNRDPEYVEGPSN